MNDREERLARVAAHEAAGWNSPPTRAVWAVSPDLTGQFDEVYFEEHDDALEYIHDHVAEKIDRDYTDEELGKNGFTLRLWRKFISQEWYETVFAHDEMIDGDDSR